ncbi:SOS response-associated peptidase [Shimia abyssi]|uniref:Abasic site processing protein n=1 Tax=Shimia abyssi TaxID=1662395 RepID=A0A2P8FK56_9RHOB|nr:SOS response-associated peptidase [Shimia abyssi]PSL22103.1 putative SOS response-associated peptidase YedK [Shimia abyssi]
MCGRFAITLPTDAMAQLFAASPANDLPGVPNYNVCPTTQIHVVLGEETSPRRLVSMRWGFIPRWYKKPSGGPLLINARAETIAEKPAFRAACRERRCLIPVSGFYEWTKDNEGARWPWYIQSDDTLALAGVWQSWTQDEEVIDTCAIVTTNANDTMSRIHHRMPVVISPDDWGLWLGENGHGAATLMRAPDSSLLSFHSVDRAVNSNRASGPQLIEPFDEH